MYDPSCIPPKDREQVRLEELKALPGVMGVVQSQNQIQAVGAATAAKVTRLIAEQTGIQAGEVQDYKAAVQDKNRTPFKLFLRRLANIFIPFIPPSSPAG